MPSQIVPLSTAPNQSLSVALSINGQSVNLKLKVSYNQQGGFWVMDIADHYGNPFICSVPLVTGAWPAGNILEPYTYLDIGSAFLINQNGVASDWADSSNLGSDFVLLWGDN
jgi:hypothetical protein